MTVKLEAPYPAIATTTWLPSPQLGDSVAATGSLDFKRSMNGTPYTYVKSRDARQKFIWTFLISQDKFFELRAFYDVFNGEQILVTDYEGTQFLGYFTSNPFEFESTGRAVASPSLFTNYQIQVEFEGQLFFKDTGVGQTTLIMNANQISSNPSINWIDGTTAVWQTLDNDTGATGQVVGNNVIINWASAQGGIISQILPAKLTIFSLRNASLSSFAFEVTENDQRAMSAMEQLIIDTNQISELQTYEWPSLRILRLQNNLISTFTTRAWPEIEEMLLQGNQIVSFAVHDWPKLKTVRIDANKLDGFGFLTKPWPNLETFDASLQDLASFETQSTWTKLTSLKLRNGSNSTPFTGGFTTYNTWVALKELIFTFQGFTGPIVTYPEWIALETLFLEKNLGITSAPIQTTWPNISLISYLTNNMSAATIDSALINLDANNNSNGHFDYRSNPGSPDGSRSGPAATAKANLVSRGWTILS